MPTNFPSGLDNIAKPVAGTDNLATPGKELTTRLAALIDSVQAVEAKVGVDASAVTTSLDYISGRSREQVATFARTGALTVTTGAARFRFPWAVTLLGTTAAIGTAPVGSPVILDVKRNGSTIYTTTANRPTIAAGTSATASEPAPDVSSLSAGDYLTVDIMQVGSTVAGSDLTVFVRYRRT